MSRLDRIMSDLPTASPEALKDALRLLTEDERERLHHHLRALAGLGMRAATAPEPAPVVTDSPAVWPLVIAGLPYTLRDVSADVQVRLAADMSARDAEGHRKYGTPLQVENGRAPAVDAYQEALDLTVYARQQWERYHTRAWWLIYEDALKLAARICAELMGPTR